MAGADAMRGYVPGWVNRDGEFVCLRCDAKGTHKGRWVLRLAKECSSPTHGKLAMPIKPKKHKRRAG